MENQTEFRTVVMGGFDKNDVLEYIKNITKQNKNNEDKLKKEIEDLKREKENLMIKEKEVGKTINMLQQELKTKDESEEKDIIENRRNINKIEELKQKVMTLNEELNKKTNELNKEEEKNRNLTYKYDKLRERCAKYEQSVMQIGTAMIEAQSKADVMVLEAKNKITKMSAETDNIFRVAADKLDDFKLDVANLKEVIQNQLEGLVSKVSNIDNTIEIVQNKFINYFIETKHIIDNEIKKYDINKQEDK